LLALNARRHKIRVMSLLHALRADISRYRQLQNRYARSAWPGVLLFITSPGLLALATQRLYHLEERLHRTEGRTARVIALRLLAALGKLITVPLTKAELQPSIEIAGGVYLSDRGNFIIGAHRIGEGTLIHHRVTIGRSLMDRGRPTIGRDVWIGPDVVIYGDIEIGDGVTILPQTVITRSIPPRTVVRGNPPRVLKQNYDNTALRQTTVAEPAGDFAGTS
jgi:serine acetyltransferase